MSITNAPTATTSGAGAASSKDPKYQVKKEDFPKILNLLKSIEDDPGAEPFLEPVAWQGKHALITYMLIELGLHDYPEIVKRPMDFSTIKKSLQKGGKYETYEDLFADVQLIWDNCKTYNIAGSDIYKLAEYMEKLAKRCI
jgi:hypothetical protein